MKIDLINGGVAIDDRGSVRFVNDFNFENVKRFYQVENHSKGFIRAWHGHRKEAKYVYVPKGSALVGAVKMEQREDLNDIHDALISSEEEPKKFILSSQKPSVLYIPPGHANGFMTLTEDTIVQFFSTSSLEDSLNDDIRFPHDSWYIWHVEER